MVQIEVTRHQKTIQEIKMTGHAESAEYGQDLVCAALTGIMSGALNAFDQKFEQAVKIIVKDNLIKVKFITLDDQLTIMIEMLMIQLKTIAVQYPKNVKIKEVS